MATSEEALVLFYARTDQAEALEQQMQADPDANYAAVRADLSSMGRADADRYSSVIEAVALKVEDDRAALLLEQLGQRRTPGATATNPELIFKTPAGMSLKHLAGWIGHVAGNSLFH